MDAEKLKAAEVKMMGAVEKHLEALALELTDIAKEIGDIAIESSNPLLKIVYAAGAPELVTALKALVGKLDLNKDGQ